MHAVIGVAFVGWLLAAVGIYRIMYDRKGPNPWQGFAEIAAQTKEQRDRRLLDYMAIWNAPRHKADRTLVYVGAIMFLGTFALGMLTAN